MSKLITTLEQLHILRNRAVKETGAKLNAQQQLCQRYEKNITALTSLAAGLTQAEGTSALQMTNHSGYKRTIQRVIDWQKQEQALADLEARQLQGALLNEARREKSLEVVLEAKRSERRAESERRERKTTDAVSAQCWLRQRLAHR
ncbi:flagellar export protein FliJ [Cedecea davisae]|uniref:Flagellar FliJ protein n=1 Tax=Cedecea davisae DSM 4568 TaxID=566551 RepID=S3K1Z1_9ENTR|nr:flagellar export protein FliJ [Cedecea davisae]EPF19219.1 flagellar export protein FliJ [Cedecea davisae DSM 4568]SUX29012.1 flagellar export protein FliJ [Cedecea davisae]